LSRAVPKATAKQATNPAIKTQIFETKKYREDLAVCHFKKGFLIPSHSQRIARERRPEQRHPLPRDHAGALPLSGSFPSPGLLHQPSLLKRGNAFKTEFNLDITHQFPISDPAVKIGEACG
jgi:hypothetical protein